jgi:hypothetical protein
MSWRVRLCGAVILVPFAIYACGGPAPTVSSAITIASGAPVPSNCLDVGDGTGRKASICWEKHDPSGGTAISVLNTQAQCIVARHDAPDHVLSGPKYLLGYATASDSPDRSLVQVDLSRESPVFVLNASSGDSKAFGDIARQVEGEIRIDLYPKPCEEVCPQMVGTETVVISATGVRAYHTEKPPTCGFFDSRSQSRRPAASPSAAASSATPAAAAPSTTPAASAAPASSAAAGPSAAPPAGPAPSSSTAPRIGASGRIRAPAPGSSSH